MDVAGWPTPRDSAYLRSVAATGEGEGPRRYQSADRFWWRCYREQVTSELRSKERSHQHEEVSDVRIMSSLVAVAVQAAPPPQKNGRSRRCARPLRAIQAGLAVPGPNSAECSDADRPGEERARPAPHPHAARRHLQISTAVGRT